MNNETKPNGKDEVKDTESLPEKEGKEVRMGININKLTTKATVRD